MMVRAVARTLGVSVEVACQRWIQAVHAGSAPSMSGAWLYPVRTGGSQYPSAATTRCSAYSIDPWCPSVAGCARSAANAAVSRSSSRGLRLSSRAWLNTPRNRCLTPVLSRYPHRSSTPLARRSDSSTAGSPKTKQAK